MPRLFDMLVQECGLSSLFAERSMRRACERAGVDPLKLGRGDLPRILPHVEQALRIYLAPDEAEKRIEALARIEAA